MSSILLIHKKFLPLSVESLSNSEEGIDILKKSKLSRKDFSVEQKLVLSINLPVAQKQTAFSLFRSIAVSLLQLYPELAYKGKTKAQFLAKLEDNMETAYLTEYDLSKYVASLSYQKNPGHDGDRSRTWTLLSNAFLKRLEEP